MKRRNSTIDCSKITQARFINASVEDAGPSREEIKKRCENGELPEGFTVDENGIVRNPMGMDVTLIGRVLADLVRSYDASMALFAKYDSDFKNENDKLFNMAIDLARYSGDQVKIKQRLADSIQDLTYYAGIIANAEAADVMVKLLLVSEVGRVIDNIKTQLAILNSLS
ncbi:hypothetical protein N0614_09445 [Pseudomonas aeruginosa]|nr:hypothetical protein [Pseudomonas aeruginosa]